MARYSREQRRRAVELYERYEHSAADVIRELGYPSKGALLMWYREWLEERRTGVPSRRGERYARYTDEQKREAFEQYKKEMAAKRTTAETTDHGAIERLAIAERHAEERRLRYAGDDRGEAGGKVSGLEGSDTGEWVLVDCGEVVVHCMQPAMRSYYNLEELWGPESLDISAYLESLAEKSTHAPETAQ